MRFAVNIPNFGELWLPPLPSEPARVDGAFVREVNAFVRDCRAEAGRAGEPFDLLISGASTPESAADVTGPIAEAGATWWQECGWGEHLEHVKPMLHRVEAGPAQ